MERPSKRFLTRLGIGLGTGLAGVGVAWGWALPAMVQARAEGALEERLGLDAEVGGASVGLTSATLESVRLRGRQEGGVAIDLGELQAHAGFGALFRGVAAVDRVTARDVRVRADLTQEGGRRSVRALRRVLSRERDGAEGTDSQSGAKGGRTYRVSGLELDVRDASGAELLTRGTTVVYGAGRITAAGEEVRLVSAAGHRGRLEEPSVELVRQPEGWRVVGVGIQGGTVVLRQHAARAEADGGSSARAAGDEASPDAPEVDGRAHGRKDTPGAPAAEEGAPDWSDRLGSAVASLTDDADIQLAGLTVRSGDGNEERVLLEDLEMTLRGQGPGVLTSRGAGRAAGGGRLRWEVDLRPAEARAEGTLHLEQLPLALATPLLPDLPWHEPDRARLDGELVVEAESVDRLAVRGDVTLVDAALASPRIAPEPVRGIGLRIEGRGHWVPADRRLVLEEAKVASGGAAVRVSGSVVWARDRYQIDLEAELPPTPCGEAVRALPADLLGETTGFSWNGNLAGKLTVDVDSRELDDTELDIHMADGCQFATVPSMADLRRFRGVFDHRVEEPDGRVFEMTTGPGSGNWQPVRSVSPFLVHAVIAHEDAAFFRHQGFAPWAIEEALRRNLEAGGYVIGASTITMQLAKNLFLRREKTLARKVQEVILTWWLESSLDKGDILELYLNVIEYGPGIYGIENAAWHYFGRNPGDLGPAESAFLATVLPNPKRHADEYRQGSISASTRNRMRRLLRHMAAKDRLDEAALEFALARLEGFGFHREGQPPAEPREIPGASAPLPVGIADQGAEAALGSWEGVFEGQEVRPANDDPFRELPEVDPDAL